MLRHFKMDWRRQQELEQQQQQQQQQHSISAPLAPVAMDTQLELDMKKRDIGKSNSQTTTTTSTKRTRGRRSSKPQMEKRRRARINECLDILKSYVLTDTANLNRFGIDPAASENQDEDTIARQILKSSGLIHRHKGRKNPNKLEKADILELTVNYVRRLHEQRDELLITSTTTSSSSSPTQINFQPQTSTVQVGLLQQVVVPAHLNQPLTLDLSPRGRTLNYHSQQQQHQNHSPPTLRAYQPPPNTPLTPPPSSASSVQSSGGGGEYCQNQVSQMILSRVLEGYKLGEWTSTSC